MRFNVVFSSQGKDPSVTTLISQSAQNQGRNTKVCMWGEGPDVSPLSSLISIGSGVSDFWGSKNWGFPLPRLVALTTVLHYRADCDVLIKAETAVNVWWVRLLREKKIKVGHTLRFSGKNIKYNRDMILGLPILCRTNNKNSSFVAVKPLDVQYYREMSLCT